MITRRVLAGSRRLLGHLVVTVGTALLPRDPSIVVLTSIPALESGTIRVATKLWERGYRPIFLVHERHSGERVRERFGEAALVLRKWSITGVLTYLRAGCVFTTHGLYGDRDPGGRKTVVNLWHGEPGGKCAGQLENDAGRSASLFPVLSSVGRAFRCAEFGVHPSRVKVLGAPRNDLLVEALHEDDRPALLRRLLWCPTFRRTTSGRDARDDGAGGVSSFPYRRDDLLGFDATLRSLQVEIQLKLHPWDAAKVDFSPFTNIEEYDSDGDFYTDLARFDGLITDVSSIWIDYLLTGRPEFFVFPDLEEYRVRRGMLLEPYEQWVPGRLVTTLSELGEEIRRCRDDGAYHETERAEALIRMHAYVDAGAADRILDDVGLRGPGPAGRRRARAAVRRCTAG